MPAPTIEFNDLCSVANTPLNNYDVLMICGGPARSTAATPLVERLPVEPEQMTAS